MRVAGGTLLLLAAVLGAPPALAEATIPPSAEAPVERFSMTPSNGGFLRLDKQTGDVSFCTVEAGQSVCRAGPVEREALEKQVAELKRENAELKAGRELNNNPSGASPLPKEEEFERALSFAERFIRRMVRVLKEESASDRI
jgi:hypothetical protein